METHGHTDNWIVFVPHVIYSTTFYNNYTVLESINSGAVPHLCENNNVRHSRLILGQVCVELFHVGCSFYILKDCVLKTL